MGTQVRVRGGVGADGACEMSGAILAKATKGGEVGIDDSRGREGGEAIEKARGACEAAGEGGDVAGGAAADGEAGDDAFDVAYLVEGFGDRAKIGGGFQ